MHVGAVHVSTSMLYRHAAHVYRRAAQACFTREQAWRTRVQACCTGMFSLKWRSSEHYKSTTLTVKLEAKRPVNLSTSAVLEVT
jgi:hypothetical protein